MQQQTGTQPLHLLCVAASSERDLDLLTQWEQHLLPLEQAGYFSVWSERHLLPGGDRQTELLAHLKQAAGVVFLLSADFFADETCLALMHDAFQRQRQVPVRLIPLLVRPVVWQDSPLGTLASLPAHGGAITTWLSPDEGWQQAATELMRLLGLPLHRQPALRSQRVETNRDRLLQRLHIRYEQMRGQSLQRAVQLELGLTVRSSAIRNAASLSLRLPDQPDQPLPPHTSIMDAYEQAHHELLILGEPGAGKSTLLLDLAYHLVKQAEADVTYSLPILLPLSSWANRRRPLQEWLVEQVTVLYDVPRKLSEHWVQANLVLPLLDGLDEMDEAARPACIATINAYHREHLHPLVVCSRTNEYNRAAEQERLALHTAVVVQPLSQEQVDAHLVAQGKPLAALRAALKKNPTLAELATTPLILQVLVLTYHGTPARQLSQKATVLQQQIWTEYVQRMIAQKGNSDRYPLQLTTRWIAFLAQQMNTHSLTVFALEELQWSWLPPQLGNAFLRTDKWLAILFGILYGLLCGLTGGLLVGYTHPLLGILFGTTIGLLSGLFVGLAELAQYQPAIAFVTTIPSYSKKNICLGTFCAIFFGLLFAIVWKASIGVPSGLLLGILCGELLATGCEISDRVSAELKRIEKASVNQRIEEWITQRDPYVTRSNLRRSLNKGIIAGLIFGLPIGLAYGIPFHPLLGLLAGLIASLSTELRQFLRHHLLRFWLWRSGLFPYKAIPFLQDATARILLRQVGGGYSFTHRLLLEYFANLDMVASSPSSDNQSTLQPLSPETS
jgi:NACHT domain/TIR domain